MVNKGNQWLIATIKASFEVFAPTHRDVDEEAPLPSSGDGDVLGVPKPSVFTACLHLLVGNDFTFLFMSNAKKSAKHRYLQGFLRLLKQILVFACICSVLSDMHAQHIINSSVFPHSITSGFQS